MQEITTVFQEATKKRVTIVAQASDKITGFSDLIQELEVSISINGLTASTYDSYSRQLGHLALHFGKLPLELSAKQVSDYLFKLKKDKDVSQAFFTFTVHAMRYVCNMRGLPYEDFKLPKIKHEKKLPVVLNVSEMTAMMKANKPLKKRLIIGILLDCGLRVSELRNLQVADIDLERSVLHVHKGKRSKDRILPLGKIVTKGLITYLDVICPEKYLFEGARSGSPLSVPSISTIVKDAAKKANIIKNVSAHSLRHSFATQLLENGVNILTIKNLLGHASLNSTLIYLHVVKPTEQVMVSALDIAYGIK